MRRNPEYKIVKRIEKRKIAGAEGSGSCGTDAAGRNGVSGKRSQTDAKIEELIGLSKEQFTQTAMIAQGDFLKLLYAKSDDRKKFSPNYFTRTHTGESRRT